MYTIAMSHRGDENITIAKFDDLASGLRKLATMVEGLEKLCSVELECSHDQMIVHLYIGSTTISEVRFFKTPAMTSTGKTIDDAPPALRNASNVTLRSVRQLIDNLNRSASCVCGHAWVVHFSPPEAMCLITGCSCTDYELME
jgi:hypothetical protein